MAARRFGNYESNKELEAALMDLEKSEAEVRDLKENLQQAGECISKLNEQVKKFKDKYKEERRRRVAHYQR